MNKTNKIKIHNIITWIVLFISIIVNIVFITKTINANHKMTITYTSVSTKSGYLYAHFEIKTKKSIKLEELGSFAILVNDTPISGYKYSDESKEYKSGTFTVTRIFDYPEITNPQFLYKGKSLKLGEPLSVKIK